MFRYIRNKKGWILADSLIGIVIVASAICALALAYTQPTKANIEATRGTYGTYLAQRTLEDLKQNDGKTAISLPEQHKVSKDSIEYTINVDQIVVTEISNATGLSTYLRPVQVTVSWRETGVDRSISMTGYYYLKQDD